MVEQQNSRLQAKNTSSKDLAAGSGGMGQAGVCGINAPLTDSLPTSPVRMDNGVPFAATPSDQTASEIQSTLTSLDGCAAVTKEDLITKLRFVVNQNLELKESLVQNNLGLRQQLGLVVRWSQQQQHQQQQQNAALTRASQMLTALQHENKTLRAKEGGKAAESSNEEVQILQHRLAGVCRQVAQVQEDRDKLNTLRARLEADVTLLKCDLTSSRGEQERLQLERAHLVATNTELKQQLRLHHLQQQQQQQEGGAASAQLRRERDTSAGLRAQCDEQRAHAEELRVQLQRAQQRAHAAETVREATGAEKGEAGLERSRLMEETVLLKEDVEVLEGALSAERVKLAEERSTNGRVTAQFNKLQAEHLEQQNALHRLANTDQYYQAKLRSASEQQDAITAKLLSYEELLAAKNEDLSKLKRESGIAKAKLAEVQSEGETIAILRAQVEVYQGDFRAEREAREALANDRETLRDEVRVLNARNTQLMDDLHASEHAAIGAGARSRRSTRPGSEETAGVMLPLYSNVVVGGATGGGGHDNLIDQLTRNLEEGESAQEGDKKESPLPPVVDESLLYCPKCNKSFKELRPLEEHVNRCLDED